jgi:hypothetical protein
MSLPSIYLGHVGFNGTIGGINLTEELVVNKRKGNRPDDRIKRYQLYHKRDRLK